MAYIYLEELKKILPGILDQWIDKDDESWEWIFQEIEQKCHVGNKSKETSEYVPGSMTDEQALEILKNMKFTMERGSAKTIFRQGLMEAEWHAIKALEEKVEAKENE